MKLSRGDKPFIDYAKMDLQDATKQLLFCFSQEELDCRDYYRMECRFVNDELQTYGQKKGTLWRMRFGPL
mgnify:CR=1 FL=1